MVAGEPLRTTRLPAALTWIGVPAYFVVLWFSVGEIVASNSDAVAGIAIAGVVLFTVVFLWLALVGPLPERVEIRAVALLAVLALALAFSGDGSAVYVYVTIALAGDRLRPRLAVPVIAAGTAELAAYALANGYAGDDVLTHTFVGFTIGLFTLGAHRFALANEELVAAREEVARLAVSNERLRFARDLHDLLGHSLTVIRAKAELASRVSANDPARGAREMGEVEELARQALADVRGAVAGYRRSSLADELASARAALDAAGIHADVATGAVTTTGATDEALGWVLREAVTNVVRHSGASRCQVEAAQEGQAVRLEIADNGRGVQPDRAGGAGLAGLRERLAAVGGSLESGAAPGGGFRVVARVPVTM